MAPSKPPSPQAWATLPPGSTWVALNIPSLDTALSLYVHGERDAYVSARLRAEGIWEPYETQLLLQALSPGDVFVDVGANLGYFSILAATVVGESGAVYAFEPDADNCALFRASVARIQRDLAPHRFCPRIHIAQAGLSDAPSDGFLYLSEDNLGDHQIFCEADAIGSLVESARSDEERLRRRIPIQLWRGSDYLAEHTGRIDFIKIDTQGSEYQVVSGLLPLLESQSESLRLMVELTPFSLRAAGSSGRDLIALLARLQLPFWIIDHVEHRLVETDAEALATWCDNVDSVADDRGFMNILVGPGL